MRFSKRTATIGVILIIVAGIQTARFVVAKLKLQRPVLIRDNKAQGDPRAPLFIVEYTDFQCPACAKGAAVLEGYIHRYPKEFYVQFRHYPLTTKHPHALKIAVYAQCAARQKKFWLFHDLAFQRQALLAKSINIDGRLTDIAQETGLELTALKACVNDPAISKEILAEKATGTSQDVQATPTYFINGKRAAGSSSLSEEVDKYFNNKKNEKN